MKLLEYFKKHKKLTRYLGLLFVIILSSVIIYFRENLAKLEEFGYIGIFLISLLGSATVILPAPTLVVTFVGGGIFNPFIVGLLSGTGAALGELTGYIVGLSGQTMIEKHKTYKKISGFVHKHSFSGIFLLALIPNPFFDIAGITAGAAGLSAKQFLIATWLGKTIRFILISYLGAGSFKILGLSGGG